MQRWLAMLGMALLSACSTESASDQTDSLQSSAPGERSERIDNWDAIKDSVAISVEPPANLQQMDAAWAQPAGSSQRIPIRKFAIEITTFTDFTCGACREVDSALAAMVNRGWIIIRKIAHFPESSNPHALQAAQGFECAEDDGQGREMATALFKAQGEFGSRTWASIADEAMVEDTSVFLRCMERGDDRRIRAGVALAERLGIGEAPAAMVNDLLLVPATPERIEQAIRDVIDRRTR